jgi:hypothetical protein
VSIGEESVPFPSFFTPLQNIPVVPVAADPTTERRKPSKHLPLSIKRPIPTEWCWAATAAAVSTFYALVHNIGRALTACQVATLCVSQDPPCCPEPTDKNDFRNRPMALEGVLSAVQHLAQDPIKATPDKPPIDFATIVKEIDGGRPICCRIAWDTDNSESGHFNAIVGYDADNQDIDISDCLYGDKTVPYAAFSQKGGYYKGTWSHVYLTN